VSHLKSIKVGSSGSLYVVIGNDGDDLRAVDLEKFAMRTVFEVTLKKGGGWEEAPMEHVLPRFRRTYEAIMAKYFPKPPSRTPPPESSIDPNGSKPGEDR
jgi:hypothetical protein